MNELTAELELTQEEAKMKLRELEVSSDHERVLGTRVRELERLQEEERAREHALAAELELAQKKAQAREQEHLKELRGVSSELERKKASNAQLEARVRELKSLQEEARQREHTREHTLAAELELAQERAQEAELELGCAAKANALLLAQVAQLEKRAGEQCDDLAHTQQLLGRAQRELYAAQQAQQAQGQQSEPWLCLEEPAKEQAQAVKEQAQAAAEQAQAAAEHAQAQLLQRVGQLEQQLSAAAEQLAALAATQVGARARAEEDAIQRVLAAFALVKEEAARGLASEEEYNRLFSLMCRCLKVARMRNHTVSDPRCSAAATAATAAQCARLDQGQGHARVVRPHALGGDLLLKKRRFHTL